MWSHLLELPESRFDEVVERSPRYIVKRPIMKARCPSTNVEPTHKIAESSLLKLAA